MTIDYFPRVDEFQFTVDDETSGTTYVPWTDGHAVGFRVSRDSKTVGYIYLNPSESDDDPSKPNVFLYTGIVGDPAQDDACTYFYTDDEGFA